MPRWTTLLGVVALLPACGARTGLDLGAGRPTPPPITFDAGCPEGDLTWLLFDIIGDRGFASAGVHAMRANGTAEHKVSLPHSPALFPSVSPDGSKLLYATCLPVDAGGVNNSALYLYDFGSGLEKLVVTTTDLTYSALSPDGKTVAYVTDYSLHAIAPDGTNDRTLLAGPNGCGTGYGHPTFTTDPHTVVYATGGIIGSIDIDGLGNMTLLTAIPGSFQYPNPAFSPDHTQIVVGLFCDQASPDALRVYPYASLPGATCLSGQVLVNVTEGSAPNMANDPSWGPSGLIAYGSGADVFTIPASGGTPTNMTATLTGEGGAVTASDPVWAPPCAQIP
jgi:hypothetical protein